MYIQSINTTISDILYYCPNTTGMSYLENKRFIFILNFKELLDIQGCNLFITFCALPMPFNNLNSDVGEEKTGNGRYIPTRLSFCA
jgi:hypothetical protein